MRELLYVPPAGETTSGAIGLLLPEFENPVFAAFAQAMETHARTAGFATILCNTAGEPLREVDYVHMLLERRVDGMIFISAEITDVRGEHSSHYRKLLERGARLVFVNGGAESLDATSVGVDERAAGRIATEHLDRARPRANRLRRRRGLREPDAEKAAGRADALEAAGLRPDHLVAHGAFSVAGGRSALRELLEAGNGDRPTAVICSSDLMAIGAMQEAVALGLDVPADLGRRVRRHRRRDVDAAALDDGRAAGRGDRGDRDRGAPAPDRGAAADPSELRLRPRLRPAAPRLRLRSTERGGDVVQAAEALERQATLPGNGRAHPGRRRGRPQARRSDRRPRRRRRRRVRLAAPPACTARHSRRTRVIAEPDAPAVRPRIHLVRPHLELDPLPLEHRLDELAQAGGQDQRPARTRELAEAGRGPRRARVPRRRPRLAARGSS